jgi:hypothetical protein
VPLTSAVPSGLTTLTVGDARFQDRYEVGTVSEPDPEQLRLLFSSDFVAWMNALAVDTKADDVTRFELRAGGLCVCAKAKLKTSESLDEFSARAARIASQVERAVAAPA